MKSNFSEEDRNLLLRAIEKNQDCCNIVRCNKCLEPIMIDRDVIGRLLKSSCSCGKFNTNFRPI